MSVKKTINGIDFYAELEIDEMYRRGTVCIDAERGEDSQSWHVGPDKMLRFLNEDSSIKNFLELDQWMEDGLDAEGWAQLDALVEQLAKQEMTYTLWFREGRGKLHWLTEKQVRELAPIFNFSADDAINSRSGAVVTDEDGDNIGGCYKDNPFDNPRGELN